MPHTPRPTTTPQPPHNHHTAGAAGDPHFIGLDGSSYDFHGVSGLVFNLVSEPESQLNALFHNLNMPTGDNTFIKALGLQQSGHGVVVDLGVDDCVAGVASNHTLHIAIDGGAPVDPAHLSTITHPAVKGTLLQLHKDRDLTVDYRATHGNASGVDEHVTLRTDRLMYTIHRQAGACHLDVDMAVLDAALLGATTMHGVLGQTARWVGTNASAKNAVIGDESDYIESGLLTHDSKFAVVRIPSTPSTPSTRKSLVAGVAVGADRAVVARASVMVGYSF